MTVRLLVIDDQLGRAGPLQRRFLDSVSVHPATDWPLSIDFHTGQTDAPSSIRNDLDAALVAIAKGVGVAEGWSLVLVDRQFLSGPVSAAGLPAGLPDDESFGERIRQAALVRWPDLPVAMLTSQDQGELSDPEVPYLSKRGLEPLSLMRSLLRHGRLGTDLLRRVLNLPPDVIAAAPSTLRAYSLACLNARDSAPCLLLGESGTGKELLARYLHTQSGRAGAFVAVNIAAVPRDLIETELFGIERSTATGVAGRSGLFEHARGGTLFLDEIGDLSLDVQAKLLRALQNGQVTRVGGREPTTMDVRIISATSKDLLRMTAEATFREDLFFRINTVPLELRPLSERVEEIAPLSELLTVRYAQAANKPGIVLAPAAMELLKSRVWRGNVRELEGVLRRAVSLAGPYETIGASLLSEVLDAPAQESSSAIPEHATDPPPQLRADSITTGSGVLASAPTLIDVLNVMRSCAIASDDPSLLAFKQKFDQAAHELLRKAAGAALERCRDPVSGSLNRQRAMQLLSNDSKLTGKGPARLVNALLRRPLDEKVETEDLEHLVSLWRHSLPGPGSPSAH